MITFMRVDDRIIHGQIVTRWSKEYPCDGIVAVNDKAATTPVLAQFKKNAQKVLESPKKYFLITKNPVDMKELLVDFGFVPSDVKRLIIGPCNDRPGATKLGQNQSITQEEADALEAISKKGYEIEFALIKESSIGTWDKYKGKFGY